MARKITKQALEAAIVRKCSPMLAGLKPACLFTFPGVFLAQGEHVNVIDSLAAYDAHGPQEQAACQALGAALA